MSGEEVRPAVRWWLAGLGMVLVLVGVAVAILCNTTSAMNGASLLGGLIAAAGIVLMGHAGDLLPRKGRNR